MVKINQCLKKCHPLCSKHTLYAGDPELLPWRMSWQVTLLPSLFMKEESLFNKLIVRKTKTKVFVLCSVEGKLSKIIKSFKEMCKIHNEINQVQLFLTLTLLYTTACIHKFTHLVHHFDCCDHFINIFYIIWLQQLPYMLCITLFFLSPPPPPPPLLADCRERRVCMYYIFFCSLLSAHCQKKRRE